MRCIKIFFFMLLGSPLLSGQGISTDTALLLADQLFKVEILSEKGRDDLKSKIEAGNFSMQTASDLLTGTTSYKRVITTSGILSVLREYFTAEFNYRSGIDIESEVYAELTKELKHVPSSEKEFRRLQKITWKRRKASKAYLIEEAIPAEDSTEDRAIGRTMYPAYSESKRGLIHPKRSVFGSTRTRTLEDLKKIGLIDDIVYQKVKQQLLAGELLWEIDVIAEAEEQTSFYESYQLKKDAEIDFAKHLLRNGLMSEKGYADFLNAYQPDELKSKSGLIPFCKNVLIFDLSKEIPGLEDYQKVFLAIKQLIPDFEFSDLDIKVEKTKRVEEFMEEVESYDYSTTVQFKAKGKVYTSSFTYWTSANFDGIEPSSSLFAGINNMLADENAKQRLYFANYSNKAANFDKNMEFGLMLMTEEEYKLWGVDAYFLSEENHNNNFNSEGVDKILAVYDSLGLFKHLSAKEIETAKESLKSSIPRGYLEILMSFPKTLIIFDWETGNLTNPYEELTLYFSETSRGFFTPTNIIDDFEKNLDNNKGTTRYGFTFKGKKYEKSLEMNSDWLDPGFIELISQAVKEAGIDLDVHYIDYDGQVGGHIWLSKSQYEFLKKTQPSLFDKGR